MSFIPPAIQTQFEHLLKVIFDFAVMRNKVIFNRQVHPTYEYLKGTF